MERFIEEIRKRGILDRMVKSCIVAHAVTDRKDVPVEAVKMMLTSEMKKDDSLTEMFVDAISDMGFKAVTDMVQEEVQKSEVQKSGEVTLKDKVEVLNVLHNVMETIISLDDDLK